MKPTTVLLLLAFLAAACMAADQIVIDNQIINTVNAHPRATWKAGENSVFKGKTMNQIRRMFGAFLLDKEVTKATLTKKAPFKVAARDLPEEFDSRKQWPKCNTVVSVRDQGHCGSCWAFSASEALSDRICIATDGKALNEYLSPQDMVSCDSGDYGCNGGMLNTAWKYLEENGIVTDECMPYASYNGTETECPAQGTCTGTGEYKKFKAKKGSSGAYETLEDAMADMIQYGPIQTGFKVYRDFFNYKSGIYRHLTGGFAGGHAVKVVGFGVDSESKVPYWIAANSWGEKFGMNGFFLIERGNDECDFESNFYAGKADV